MRRPLLYFCFFAIAFASLSREIRVIKTDFIDSTNGTQVVELLLSKKVSSECSIAVLDNLFSCLFKDNSNSTILCQLPLMQSQDINFTEIPQTCFIQCGEHCEKFTPHIPILNKQFRILNTLQSFFPQSASFVYPTYLKINFDDGKDVQEIVLFNSSNTVKVFILRREVSFVNAIVKGGPPGSYKFKFTLKDGTVITDTQPFNIGIVINRVTPNEGRKVGGVILNIEGENFSLIKEQNVVTIGNVGCDIISFDTSHITCITQPPPSPQPLVNTLYEVKVGFGSYSSSSNEKFTFKDYSNIIPTIISVHSASTTNGMLRQGEEATITGTNLEVNGITTILQISGNKIPIASNGSGGFTFKVPSDLSLTKQNLTMFVGQYGSSAMVITPVTNSQCIQQNSLYFISAPLDDEYLYLDINLPSYPEKVKVTIDGNDLDATIVDLQVSSNHISLRLKKSQFSSPSPYIPQRITSIVVDNVNVLFTPITLQAKEMQILSIDYLAVDLRYFHLLISPNTNQGNLIIFKLVMLILNAGQEPLQLDGDLISSNDSLKWLFKKVEATSTSQIFVQGCSNLGPIYQQISLPAEFISNSGNIQWRILDNPFPSNLLHAGRYFTAEFSFFHEVYNLFGLICDGYNYPIEWKEKIDYNIYKFKIPPRFTCIDTDFGYRYNFYGANISCKLYLFDSWNQADDELITAYPFDDYLFAFRTIQQIWPDLYQYDNPVLDLVYPLADHMVILSFSPTTISYLGGEELTLSGNFLRQTDATNVTVTLNDIVCSVTEATTTYIKCTTGFQKKVQWIKAAEVIVYEEGIQVLIAAEPLIISFRQVDPLPFLEQADLFLNSTCIYVPSYYEFILDDEDMWKGKQMLMKKIYAMGYIDFEPVMNYNVSVEWMVGWGGIRIGRENKFVEKTIEFKTTKTFDVFRVQVHGDTSNQFFYLTESALKDQNYLKILQSDISASKFVIGDILLISGTTLGTKEEYVVINSFQQDKIILSDKLKYDHIFYHENFSLQGGTQQEVTISPTLIKINKNIKLIFSQNLTQSKDDFGVTNRYEYKIEGANLYLDQIYGQRPYWEASSSIIEIQQNGNLIESTFSINTSLMLNFIPHRYSTQNINQSLFINKDYTTLELFSGTLDSNTFQNYYLWIHEYQSFYKNLRRCSFSNSIIYNTEICLREQISILGSTTCFSAKQAFEFDQRSQGILQYPTLIAIDIVDTMVSIYPKWSSLFHYSNIIFKSTYDPNSIQRSPIVIIFKYKAPIYDLQKMNLFVSKRQLFQFPSNSDFVVIKIATSIIEFPSDAFIANPEKEFAVSAPKGCFTNLFLSVSVFSVISNLHNSDCINNLNYSICPYPFAYFKQIYWLTMKDYGSFDKLILKRTNTKIITPQMSGFSLPCNEVYTAELQNNSEESLTFQTISFGSQYVSGNNCVIIIQFKLVDHFIEYYFAQLYSSNIEDILTVPIAQQIVGSSSPFTLDNCAHGQNYKDSDYLSVCYDLSKNDLSLNTLFDSIHVYPYVTREIIDPSIRDFENPDSWKNLQNESTQKNDVWTIQSNWKMKLSKGGEYLFPSLLVQGELIIDGEKTIIIRTYGIYIAAGTITIASTFKGTLTIDLQIDQEQRVIFKVPKQTHETHQQGTFLINGQLNISDNNTLSTGSYRIISYQGSPKKILVSELDATILINGDRVFITSPRTGQTYLREIQSFQQSGPNVILTLTNSIDFEFSSPKESFQVGIQQINLRPYLKILPRRIRILNSNIKIDSFGYYQPSVSIFGVSFENSSISLLNNVGSFSIDSCSFVDFSPTNTTSRDFYILNSGIRTQPTFSLASNIFFNRTNLISLPQFGGQVSMAKNMLIQSTSALFTENYINLSENIFINSTSCLNSQRCPSTNGDKFIMCKNTAINSACSTISNILVAFSDSICPYPQVLIIDSITSISNKVIVSFVPQPENNYLTMTSSSFTMKNSFIIADLDATQCTSKSSFQLFYPCSYKFSLSTIFISSTIFSHYYCSKLLQIASYPYLPLVVFTESKCSDCSFHSLSDLLGISPPLSPSFLIQDMSNKLFQSLSLSSNLPTTSFALLQNHILNVKQPENTIGRLFISASTSSVNLDGNTISNTEVGGLGVIVNLEGKKIFTVGNSQEINTSIYRFQSYQTTSFNYIQIKFKPKYGYGIKFRKNKEVLKISDDLNTSSGYSILNLVLNDFSKIQCGIVVYEQAASSYYILITSEDDCFIEIYQYPVPVVVLKLPKFEAQYEEKCLAQRQRLFLVNRLAKIFNIPEKRVKILAQSNIGTCKAKRMLADESSSDDDVTFEVQIDSSADSDDSSGTNCIYAACTDQQKAAQAQASLAENSAIFDKLTNFSTLAANEGLVVSFIATGCSNNTVSQDGTCVQNCLTGYYAKNAVCLKCNSNCITCTKESKYGCSVLQAGKLDCIADMFTYPDLNNILFCDTCPAHCLACEKQLCLQNSCESGYQFSKGRCLPNCESAQYFSKEEKCIPCPEDCATCTSSTSCLTCYKKSGNLAKLCEEDPPNFNVLIIILSCLGLICGGILFWIVGKVVVRSKLSKINKIKKYEAKSSLHEKSIEQSKVVLKNDEEFGHANLKGQTSMEQDKSYEQSRVESRDEIIIEQEKSFDQPKEQSKDQLITEQKKCFDQTKGESSNEINIQFDQQADKPKLETKDQMNIQQDNKSNQADELKDQIKIEDKQVDSQKDELKNQTQTQQLKKIDETYDEISEEVSIVEVQRPK